MFKRLFSYMGKYKKYTFLAMVCVIAETFFELIIPLIMADIVDIGVANRDEAYILRQGIIMGVCALLALALGTGSARFAALCGQGLGAEIRKATFRKVQQFSFANRDKFRTASLVTRLTGDVTTIQNSVSTGMRPAVRSPFMLLTSLILSFTINAKLALVFVVAIPILGTCLILIIRRVRPLYGRMQKAVDLVNRIIQENLTAIRIVKAYVKGDYETEKFAEVNTELKTTSEKAFGTAVLNMPAMQAVMYATILAILWIGGNLIFIGSMKVGELTGFLSYVLQVLNSLMLMSNVFLMMTRSITSWKRISEVLDEKNDISEDRVKDISVEHGSIHFDHVFFKYSRDAEEYVLQDINLDIKSGQTIGIIGSTGSAKSTLVQLIPRLYEATKGQIYIDDRPIEEYPLRHLRDSIAMVLQKNTLFSGTVKDNLRWGNPNATDEEIEEACHIACVDEFIDRLENGYDTELGQGGVNVSGGQKQRLCIARAILKKPKVLILDDSTSAVDTTTEAKIREGLANCLPDCTKIIIAQRITSVLNTDMTIVLNDGKIECAGDHWYLMDHSSVYQEIYNSQQEGAGL